MELGAFEILLALLATVGSFYLSKLWNLTYWRKRRIPGPTPVPIFGNFGSVFFHKLSHAELFQRMYNDWRSEPVVGFYKGHKPMLLIQDLDIVKDVMIRDFNVFSSRGLDCNEKIDPLSPTLFSLDGEYWKILRTKFSPIFTSSKLKNMTDLILECADALEGYLRNCIEHDDVIECREISAKYTTDIFGSCVFGINMNALAREDSDFRRIGRNLFPSSYWTIFTRHLRDALPEFYRFFKLRQFSKEVSDFFLSTILETVEFREKENIIRHDLVDLIVDIKKNHDQKEIALSDELLAAQAFGFFIGGADTAALGMAFALFELAHAPEIQEKLRAEIHEVLDKHGGKISYDMLTEMKYLDMVFQETLRKNPILPALERQTTGPYVISKINLKLEKGTKVYVPCYAFQHDPKYFPNPEVFDPERFSEKAKGMRHPMAWLAFGDGPKSCAGFRFASLGVKIGIITVLKDYRLEKSQSSPMPYELDRGTFFLVPRNGMKSKFKLIR